MIEAQLPAKPSDLIDLGLKDLAAIEANEAYRVDMNDWHEPHLELFTTEGDSKATDVCLVCFAGAIMANTMKFDAARSFSPTDAPNQGDRSRLMSLNAFRQGYVEDGLDHFDVDSTVYDGPDGLPSYIEVVPYADNSDLFKRDMTAMSMKLKAAGL